MPLVLDTNNPLYGDLGAFVCVDDDDQVKDLINTDIEFTLHAEASVGSGPLGRHLQTLNAGYTPKGAALSPAIPLNTNTGVNPNVTMLYVFNQLWNGGGSGVALGAGSNVPNISLSGGVVSTKAGHAGSARATGTIGVVDEAPHTIVVRRTGETAHDLIVDGVIDATGAGLGYNAADQDIAYLGGYNGQGSFQGQWVYFILFLRVLTDEEVASVLSSIQSNNRIGLLQASNYLGGTLAGDSSITGDIVGGVLAEDIPTSGEHGPSFLANDVTLPADAGKRISYTLLTVPSAGTLETDKYGRFTFSGAPAGKYTFTYQLEVDGNPTGGPSTVTIRVHGAGELSGAGSGDGNITGELNQLDQSALGGVATGDSDASGSLSQPASNSLGGVIVGGSTAVAAVTVGYSKPMHLMRCIRSGKAPIGMFVHDGETIPLAPSKDPNSVVDYGVDHEGWMPPDDAIKDVAMFINDKPVADGEEVEGLRLRSITHDDKFNSAFWVELGELEINYKVTTRILTKAGRVDDRSMFLRIIEK